MNLYRIGWTVGVVLTLACAGPAVGSGHPCADMVEPQARLACYDQAFPPSAGAGSIEGGRPSEAQVRAEFGLSGREADERKPESERAPRIEQIEAVISSLRVVQGGQRVLSLDNDQVWQLTEGGTRGLLKVGDSVVIKRGMFGSYLLTTPGGVGLRARRVR